MHSSKMRIGDKDKFAFIIGDRTSRDLREVDIYIANELITYYDNAAYIPQFAFSLECEASDIENRKVSNDYVFLDWGPTTDDVVARGVVDNKNIQLLCKLDNGKEIDILLSTDYVVSVYKDAAKTLREMHA